MPVMNATFLAIATVRGQRRSPATSRVDLRINYSYFLFFCGGWEEQVLLKTKGVAIDRHRWVTRNAWLNGEHMGKGAMAGRSTDDLMVRGGYGYLQQSQVRDASNPPRV